MSHLFIFLTLLISSDLIMAEEHTQLRTVLQANGEFTKNLYKILAKEPGNVFFSPISIHAILSLSSQGSDGQTKKDFIKALCVPDLRVAAEGYKDVMTRLNSIENVTLLIANKVFVMDQYKLREQFKSVATQQFFSEVQSLNFVESNAAAKSINSWVEQKTNNKIKDLIQSTDLNQDTRLVLVNAIYFKGKWAEPFSVANTASEKFYLNDNDTVDVQMMHTKKKFYFKNDDSLDAKVLELPYANNDISLIVILPNQKSGIGKLEQKLAKVDLTRITENMHKVEVQVALPKFKIEQTIDLKIPLTEVGLGNIFSRTANFSGLIDSSEELYVSKVIQKAFIEVNEEGAEAAAATGVHIRMRTARIRPPPQCFKADHPFIVIVSHTSRRPKRRSRMVNPLFIGKLLEPAI